MDVSPTVIKAMLEAMKFAGDKGTSDWLQPQPTHS
jgi:hypothetical protein